MRAIDRLDKVPPDVVAKQLVDEAGLTEEQAAQCLRLAEIRTSDSSFVSQVWALGVAHAMLDEGLDELAAVIDGCASISGVTVEADLRIARGLDYYTGTVFETRMAGYERLGSICSGGRYDSLAIGRQDHLSRRGHLAGCHPAADAAVPARRAVRFAPGALGGAGGAAERGRPGSL